MKKHTNYLSGNIWLPISILLLALTGCATNKEEPEHRRYTVEIKQMQFQPAELVIQKGDTIEWINHDIVTHDITEEPNKVWASSALANGQSWTKVFTESANYYCAIHQVMKGKIMVQ